MIKPISILGSFFLILSVAPISIADSAFKLVQKSSIAYSYECRSISGYCIAEAEQYLSDIGYTTARDDVVKILGEPNRTIENVETNTDDYYYDGALILVGRGTNSVILMKTTAPRFSTPSGLRVGLTLEEVKKILGCPEPFIEKMKSENNYMRLHPCLEYSESSIVLQFNNNDVVTEISLGMVPP